MRKYYHDGDGIIRETDMTDEEFKLIKEDWEEFTYEDLLVIIELANCQINKKIDCFDILSIMSDKQINRLKYKISSWLSDQYSWK